MSEAKIVLTADDRTKAAFASAIGNLGGLHTAAESVKGTLEALGVTLSAGYFAELIHGAIDANEHLQNLHVSTDLSVTDLAGLRLLAKQTGTDLDGLARGVNRMSVEIGKAPEKFHALGITATDSKGALKQFADIFNLLPDIQQRNALAQAVFQKSWAEMAPTLAKGSAGIEEIMEKGARLSGVTAELTAQSAAFNDKIAELTGTGGLMNRQVATLLPLLNTLADDLLDVQAKTAKADEGFHPLAETLRALVVLGGNVSFVFQGIGREIGGAAAQAALFASGDFSAALKVGPMIREDAEKSREEFDKWEKKIMAVGTALTVTGNVSDAISRRLASAARVEQAAAAARAKAFLDSQNAAKEADTAFDQINKRVGERLAAQKAELAAGRPLTDQEKFEAKILADLTLVKRTLTAEEERGIKTKLAESRVKDLSLHQLAEEIKAVKELAQFFQSQDADLAAFDKARGDQRDRVNKGLADQTRELTDSNEQLQLEGALLGATDKERAVALGLLKVEQQRKLDIEKINQDLLLTEEARTKAIASRNSNAELEKQQVTMRANNEELLRDWQKLDSAGRDVFGSLFQKGGDTLHKLGGLIKTELIDELYKLTAQKWVFEIFANITGSAASGAVQGGTSALVGAGNLASGAGSLLGAGAGATMQNGLVSGFSANMANISTLAEGGEFMGALSAAAPYLAVAAIAATVLSKVFGSKGGPKTTSAFGPDLNQQDLIGDPTQAKGVVDTLNAAYAQLAHTIGLANDKLNASVLISTDPKGKAQTILEVASATANYSRSGRLGGVENVGRSDAELQAAISEETTRLIFAALKQSNLSELYKSWLNAVGETAGVADMQAVIDHISKAATEKQQLEAKLFDLTATDLEKLNKTRADERAAVDDSNRALLEQVYAEEDLKNATGAANATLNTQTQILADLQTAHDALAAARQGEVTNLQSTLTATESAATRFRALTSSLRDFRDSLQLGELSPLTPAEKYAAAQQQFEATYAAAQGGDADAMQRLQQVSTDFLQASQTYFASSDQYARDFARVQTALTLSATKADQLAASNEAQVAIMNAQLSALNTINSSVLTIPAALAQLAQAVSAALAAGLNPGADNLAALTGGVTGQYVDTAVGPIYTSTGGASVTGGRLYTINGQSYTVAEAVDYINALVSSGRPVDAYYAFKSAGVSLADADVLMQWAPMTAENWATANGYPVFGTGGLAMGPALVGDRGPEIVDFATPGRVYTADQTRGMFGDNTALRTLLQQAVNEISALRAENARNTGDMVRSTIAAAQLGAEKFAEHLQESHSVSAWKRGLEPVGAR